MSELDAIQKWVISRPERPDRLAAFTARAAAAGLECRLQPGLTPQHAREGWNGSLPSLGCLLAHQAILSTSSGTVAIFEDDALLPPDLGQRLGAALAALPPDWELLALGAGNIVYGPQWRAPVHQLASFALSHAYLVSERGRAPVLDAARWATRHWDHTLGPWLGRRARSWLLCPPIGQDDALGSDIPDSYRLVRS